MRGRTTIPLLSLVAFHLVAAGALIAIWHSQSRNTPTGDEPHYLVIADSIARYHSLEVTRAYESELETHRMYAPGLVPPGKLPRSKDKHERVGPNGSFSIHNLGLPLLILPALELRGPMGVRLFMLLVSSLVPVIAWISAGFFIESVPLRWLVALASAFSAQFQYYAGQIYPDLLGGIAFGVVAIILIRKWILRDNMGTASTIAIVLLAFMPWVHIRFIAPAAVCLAAMFLIQPPRRSQNRTLMAASISIAVGLLVLLGLYNKYAFDQFAGPYPSDALAFSKGTVMAMVGIHLDQFEGIFLEAPILLAAVLGMAALMRRDWRVGIFLLMLHASFVVPTAMHYPDWYGGGSPAGRFGLAAAVVLLIPATCGLAMLAKRFPKAVTGFCGLHILLQGCFWLRYGPMHFNLYSAGTFGKLVPLNNYRSLYSPFQNFLPAFYRLDLVLTHWPNYVALALVSSLAIAGWRMAGTQAPFSTTASE